MYNRIIYKLKEYNAVFYRKKVIKEMRERNSVNHISIISSNCIGCLFLHDLGLRFESPTVNLYFNAKDFVKFVSNLKYYCSLELSNFQKSKEGYPIGFCGDLQINFVHYKTTEECIEKWNARKKRIDFNNICLIFTDRDGLTIPLLREYLALPYKKIVFVANKDFVLSDECIYIPDFDGKNSVGEMDKYADWHGKKYYEKYFDIVGWLNK